MNHVNQTISLADDLPAPDTGRVTIRLLKASKGDAAALAAAAYAAVYSNPDLSDEDKDRAAMAAQTLASAAAGRP